MTPSGRPATTAARFCLPPLAAATLISTLVAALFLATTARGEVMAADERGFALHNEVQVSVDRARAYQAFVTEIAQWWNPDHTISGQSAQLFLDPRPMGCFCESTGEGSGMVHMIVTLATPPAMLRLTGGLGPLGLQGVSGNLTVEFVAQDESQTQVIAQYTVGGYSPDGLAAQAPAVDAVIDDLLSRFAGWVEVGTPEPDIVE